MIVSRLSTRYPLAVHSGRVIFPNDKSAQIDPIFLGRLAALAKSMNKVIHATGIGGKRDPADQIQAYLNSGGHRDADGTWSGGNGLAAKPNTSMHEKGMAFDTSDPWLKELEHELSTMSQKTLNKFGLYKPLTKGNHKTVLEDWHIQPIELYNLSEKQRELFYPLYVDCDLKVFQKIVGLTPDGIYGALTHEKAFFLFA